MILLYFHVEEGHTIIALKEIIKAKRFIIPVFAVLLGILTSVTALNVKKITVVADGKSSQYMTLESTVKQVLEDKKIYIGPKDKIEPSLDSRVFDKECISIKRAVNVKVSADGKLYEIQSAEENIDSMLKAEGIALKTEDKVKPEKNTKLAEGMQVDVIRVDTKTLTENLPVGFEEIIKKDSSLPNTSTRIVQEGKNGTKQVTTRVVYENGNEVSKEILSEKIITKPVNRIVVHGTYPLMPVSSRGEAMPYSRVIRSEATAYWAVSGVGKTYTASGRKAVRNPDGYSTIAVDPGTIPYGTKLFVEGYGFAIAADTGLGIKGNKIDVFFDTYNEACRWGKKYVNVYILK